MLLPLPALTLYFKSHRPDMDSSNPWPIYCFDTRPLEYPMGHVRPVSICLRNSPRMWPHGRINLLRVSPAGNWLQLLKRKQSVTDRGSDEDRLCPLDVKSYKISKKSPPLRVFIQAPMTKQQASEVELELRIERMELVTS